MSLAIKSQVYRLRFDRTCQSMFAFFEKQRDTTLHSA